MNDARKKLQEKNWAIINYKPLPAQIPIHYDDHRIILVAGGEGSGKSYVTAALAIGLYPTWRLAYVVGPKYQSCRPEFDYIHNWLLQMGETNSSMVSSPASGAASLRSKLGSQVQTISAEDGPNAITGTGKSPDLIMLVEAGKVGYDIFLACRNRVARVRGILIISGTFEGSEGWYPEMFSRWQVDNMEGARSYSLPTWSNTILYPKGEQDDEIKLLKATNPIDIFNERFGAVPNKPSTLVFREFEYTRNVKPSPFWLGHEDWIKAPVDLAIDPGYAGAYSVLAIQRDNNHVYVIDEVYRKHTVTEQIINICRERPWWHLWKGGTIDIAGTQHQALPSVVDEWHRITGRMLEYKKITIQEGIRRTRTFLLDPMTGDAKLILDPRCKETIWEATKGYKYHEVVEGRPTHEEPIDAHNHSWKALAYYLYIKYGPADVAVQKIKKPKKPSPWGKVLRG